MEDMRPSAARRALEDRADGVDRVGVLRPLVRTVSLDPGEPQRHAARIAGARLHAVERHLDHQLGADEDGRCVARGLELLESLAARDDGPWAAWWASDLASDGGKKKATAALARRLRKFDPNIKATQATVDGERARGYDRSLFEDVWRRSVRPSRHTDRATPGPLSLTRTLCSTMTVHAF